MQGIPENSTLMSLSRSVMPSGLLAGELPGTPMVTGSIKSQVKSSASHRDGSPTQNENGIRSSKEPRKRKFTSFNIAQKEDSTDATTKLLKKNRMIARLDIVCLILFPIVFLMYAAIYLMMNAL